MRTAISHAPKPEHSWGHRTVMETSPAATNRRVGRFLRCGDEGL
jgi:hypothetical protein